MRLRCGLVPLTTLLVLLSGCSERAVAPRPAATAAGVGPSSARATMATTSASAHAGSPLMPIPLSMTQVSNTRAMATVQHPTTGDDAVANRKAFLARVADVTANTLAARDMPQPRGIVLLDVMAGGAAADSGLVPGDIIFAVERAPVTTVDDFARDLAYVPAGAVVTVSVWRADAARQLPIRF